MAAYLTLADFKLLSVIPPDYLDFIETSGPAPQPGWTLAKLAAWSRWLDARLKKRYAIPLPSATSADPNFPSVAQQWLCDLATFDAYLKRGIDPTDAQIQEIEKRYNAVKAEVQEAADAESGLFELPLRTDGTGQGVTKGAPLFATQTSPYTWRTQQRAAGVLEDEVDDDNL